MIKLMDSKKDYGARLARVRDGCGHTQESLSAATGISRQHIQKIESGIHSPTIATLEAMLLECKSSLRDFFESRVPLGFANIETQTAH